MDTLSDAVNRLRSAFMVTRRAAMVGLAVLSLASAWVLSGGDEPVTADAADAVEESTTTTSEPEPTTTSTATERVTTTTEVPVDGTTAWTEVSVEAATAKTTTAAPVQRTAEEGVDDDGRLDDQDEQITVPETTTTTTTAPRVTTTTSPFPCSTVHESDAQDRIEICGDVDEVVPRSYPSTTTSTSAARRSGPPGSRGSTDWPPRSRSQGRAP